MKVNVNLTLDLDQVGWAAERGVTPREVGNDVRLYVRRLVLESAAGERGLIRQAFIAPTHRARVMPS